MRKTLFILLIMLMISLGVVMASTYESMGEDDFRQGTGFFNQQLTAYDQNTRALASPEFIPLISDLNNDSTNEIIVLDGTTIRIYQNTTLDILDSFSSTNISNSPFMYIYDIDGDDNNEILLTSSGDGIIDIIQYNETHGIVIEKSHSGILTGHSNGQVLLSCRDTEICMAVWTDQKNTNDEEMKVTGFNSTSDGSVFSIRSNAGTSVHCFPKIPVIDVKDYDNDAVEEFIFSFIDIENNNNNDELSIQYITINSTLDPVRDLEINNTQVYEVFTGAGDPDDCLNGATEYGGLFTSPLVHDFDASSSNGLETVIGLMEDDDEYVMVSYDSNGVKTDDYPEVFQADGEIISNVMRVNAFPDSGNNDFCVVGYEDTDEEVDVLCASIITGESPQTREFIMDVSSLYTVNNSREEFNIITHTAQHSTRTTSGSNLDEIITSYGVGILNWSAICRVQVGANIFCYDIIFEDPQEDSVLLSVDVMDVGRDDLISYTQTNIWYLDDQFTRSGGEITDYYVDPCIDATWQVNTSVEVRITVTDPEADLVSARAILYSGTGFNTTSDWTTNSSSGTTFTFSFTANETIGTGTLRLQGTDDSEGDIDTIDLTISVGSSGVTKGDCTTNVDVTTLSEAGVPASGLNATTRGTVRTFLLFGADAQYTFLIGFIYLLFVFVGLIGILIAQKITDPTTLIVVPSVGTTIAWILLVGLGMIPAWTLYVGIFIFAGLFGFKFYQARNSSGGM